MTDVMERVDVHGAGCEPGCACVAPKHAASGNAYRRGECRCAGAARAWAEVAERTRLRDRARERAARNISPDCPAAEHRMSEKGYADGCRCPGAIASHERELEMDRRRYRNRGYPPQRIAEMAARRADHACPGRRVDRIMVLMLTSGCPQPATTGEMMLAVEHARRMRHPWGEPLRNEEIAERLGIGAHAIQRYARMRAALRADRSRRRLLDVQAKAARMVVLQRTGKA